MNRLALVSSLVALLILDGASGFVHHTRPSARVIIGQNVDDHATISFYCTLYVEFEDDAGTSICGCALIGDGRAVTAAHCVVRRDPSDPAYVEYASAAYARAYGPYARLEGTGIVRVDLRTFRLPRTFRNEDLHDDVAAFRVPGTDPTDVVLNPTVAVWDALSSWDKLHVVGVGLDRNKALSLGAPREAHLSRRACADPVGFGDLLPWPASATRGDVCAGPFSPCDADERCADSCRGDSGGPLYRRESGGTIRVFALVSRGNHICGVTGERGGRPGIYAPTHVHHEFMHNETSANSVSFDTYVQIHHEGANAGASASGASRSRDAVRRALIFLHVVYVILA